jgi:transcription termination/antitermination protein NusG
MLIDDPPEKKDTVEESRPTRDPSEDAVSARAASEEAAPEPTEEPEAPAADDVAPPLADAPATKEAAPETAEGSDEAVAPPTGEARPEPEEPPGEAGEPMLQPEGSDQTDESQAETAEDAAEVAEPAGGEAPSPETVEADRVPEEVAGAQPEEAAAAPVTEADVEVPSGDPFGGPGDWYVIHTYAGYENKVKTNLGSRIHTMQMQDKIFDVVIPMEDVMEIKGGKKQVVQKKVFPGYLLVKMVYDDDSWYVVRNTPGVTGFVSSGTGQKPTPLSRGEVEKILAVKKEEVKPTFRLDFEEGDVVRIISGPFADFNGTISDINVDQSKVRVMVNIFDRETPVELSFDQVARV